MCKQNPCISLGQLLEEWLPAGAGSMPPLILDLRASCWEQGVGAGRDAAASVTVNHSCHRHQTAGQRCRGTAGSVKAPLTFRCEMSKCASAIPVLPQQHLHRGEARAAGRAGQQMGEGEKQQRPRASAVRCLDVTVWSLKMMLFMLLHSGNTQNTAEPYGEMSSKC